MSNGITVEVDDSRLRVRLAYIPDRLMTALKRETTVLRLQMEALVKNKLSGQVLNVRTGALRRSIFSDQTQGSTSVTGRVAQSADVPYGRIHEYGGKTSAHDIIPTRGKVLAFAMGGKMQFATIVHHPGSQMPERSFMRTSLAEMQQEIVDGYQRAVKESDL